MTTQIQKLLEEIKAKTGWSQPRIAVELGTTQPTVNRLLKGQKDCQASTWRAIEELHQSICKGKRRRAQVAPP